MNFKQLTVLVGLAAVLGFVGVGLRWKSTRSWDSSREKDLKFVSDSSINDVTHISIKTQSEELNLLKEADEWKVKERAQYPANFEELSSFLRKIWELKPVQTIKIGAVQLSRLELATPGTGASGGSGTLIELKDKTGKVLKSLVLGKNHSGSASGSFQGGSFPNGRYVIEPGKTEAAVVSETFSNITPEVQRWLNKEFIKPEKVREVSIASRGWKIARESEASEWKFTDRKGGQVDQSKASTLGSLFSSSFSDVVVSETKPAEMGLHHPTVAEIKTFDGFLYRINIGKKNAQENYFVQVSVSGDFERQRKTGKEEKPEDKAKLDKEFQDRFNQLEAKLKREKTFEKWVYLFSKWSIDSILKERKDFMVEKAEVARTKTK